MDSRSVEALVVGSWACVAVSRFCMSVSPTYFLFAGDGPFQPPLAADDNNSQAAAEGFETASRCLQTRRAAQFAMIHGISTLTRLASRLLKVSSQPPQMLIFRLSYETASSCAHAVRNSRHFQKWVSPLYTCPTYS